MENILQGLFAPLLANDGSFKLSRREFDRDISEFFHSSPRKVAPSIIRVKYSEGRRKKSPEKTRFLFVCNDRTDDKREEKACKELQEWIVYQRTSDVNTLVFSTVGFINGVHGFSFCLSRVIKIKKR